MPEQQTRLIAPAADIEIRDAVAIHIALRHAPTAAPGCGGNDVCAYIAEVARPIVLPGAYLLRVKARHPDGADHQIGCAVSVEIHHHAAPAGEAVLRQAAAGVFEVTLAIVEQQAGLRVFLPAVIVAGQVEKEDIRVPAAIGVEHMRFAAFQWGEQFQPVAGVGEFAQPSFSSKRLGGS